MRRILMLLAVVLCCSSVSAAPPNPPLDPWEWIPRPPPAAEMAPWMARWQDVDRVLVIANHAEELECRFELMEVEFIYPGTVAAWQAKMTRDYIGMRPRRASPLP